MELALKAWFVFDFDNPKAPKSQDLAKLFETLKPESQEKLDAEYKTSVAPNYPDFFHPDCSIRDILYQHKDAFVNWRYLHETKSTMFDRGCFRGNVGNGVK